MTNTFLEDLKELGYSQEEALAALKSIKEKGLEPSDPAPEEPPPEEPEEPEIDTPEAQVQQISDDSLKDILKTLRAETSDIVKSEITKQLKVVRGSPPEGEVGDTPSERPIVQKNEFERMV